MTFSDPIEQPSNAVQKLQKEIAELEFKLKHTALIEAELRAEIEMLRKNTPEIKSNIKLEIGPENKPVVFIDKKKSEPEINISLA